MHADEADALAYMEDTQGEGEEGESSSKQQPDDEDSDEPAAKWPRTDSDDYKIELNYVLACPSTPTGRRTWEMPKGWRAAEGKVWCQLVDINSKTVRWTSTCTEDMVPWSKLFMMIRNRIRSAYSLRTHCHPYIDSTYDPHYGGCCAIRKINFRECISN